MKSLVIGAVLNRGTSVLMSDSESDDDDETAMKMLTESGATVSADELWALMELAKTQSSVCDGAGTDSSEELTTQSTINDETKKRQMQSRDPAVHMCLGMSCLYLVYNDDATATCSVTGICHGQRSSNDPVTAGLVKTRDDTHCSQLGC